MSAKCPAHLIPVSGEDLNQALANAKARGRNKQFLWASGDNETQSWIN